MKKTDFGIIFDSLYDNDWTDEKHYVMYYDLADDFADNGNKLHCWLEVVYNAEERVLNFNRVTEDENGYGESNDVEKFLPYKTKRRIIDDLEMFV